MKTNFFANKLYMGALSLTLLTSALFTPRARAQGGGSSQTVAADTLRSWQPEPGHTYWKHPSYDAILDMWECKERGICMRLHTINPDDPEIRKLTAKETKKKIEDITHDDLAQMCGYEMQFSDMKRQKDGSWQGKLYIKSRDLKVKVVITPPQAADSTLRMRGSISEGFWNIVLLGNPGDLVGRTYVLNPVQNPPQPCKLPSAP